MLIATVALFSVPQLSSPHGGADPDIHASENGHHDNNSAADPLLEIGSHCHSGLECSAQAVFDARHNAQIRTADLRLSFQFVNIFTAGLFVAFDPPPPRFLS